MIALGNRKIGIGQPCFIAAEIGINHNGDMDLAVKMIDSAVESGVDGVKFQNYYTEDFIIDKELTHEYVNKGVRTVESQYDMFKRYELTREQLHFLSRHCEKKGVIFFSTPTSKRGIDDLMAVGVPILKNGSDLLVNHEIIKDMAETKLPLIISTGMATLAEIDDAVRVFERSGGKELLILHCISSYPTPDEDVNLRKIPALQAAFGYPVGFSDHTWGIEAVIGAVAFGACFVEKHFTTDKALPGPDHSFSSDPAEMRSLVKAIRKIELCLGTSKIGPTKSEQKGRHGFRLSCAAARDLPSGHRVTKEDFIYLRPASGIAPKDANLFLGKILRKSISRGGFFLVDHFN